ncbi:hypothetical protein U9M48_025788 [Paspalum notatum var. saurae]|uniref:Uncharacterized protein n=1 Tax=Paspalum notatum var. saurae TaxID=547442 RepID=A0AAQ3TTZ5_PASNO
MPLHLCLYAGQRPAPQPRHTSLHLPRYATAAATSTTFPYCGNSSYAQLPAGEPASTLQPPLPSPSIFQVCLSKTDNIISTDCCDPSADCTISTVIRRLWSHR